MECLDGAREGRMRDGVPKSSEPFPFFVQLRLLLDPSLSPFPPSLPHLQHRHGRVRELVVQVCQIKKGPAWKGGREGGRER